MEKSGCLEACPSPCYAAVPLGFASSATGFVACTAICSALIQCIRDGRQAVMAAQRAFSILTSGMGLSADGDSQERLATVVDFERFRAAPGL